MKEEHVNNLHRLNASRCMVPSSFKVLCAIETIERFFNSLCCLQVASAWLKDLEAGRLWMLCQNVAIADIKSVQHAA